MDIWQISQFEIILRMILSVILGGLIGIEREWSNHAAGFRTHILVCLGSTMIMLLSIYGFSQFASDSNVRLDPARLAAQVISGIGFLGAGAIMRNGNIVKGLTTAASVWVVAGIGLCVGAGFLTSAVFCTFLVLVCLYLLNKWEKNWWKHQKNRQVELKITNQPDALGQIVSKFGEYGISITNVKLTLDSQGDDGEAPIFHTEFQLQHADMDKWLAALEEIASLKVVLSLAAVKPGLGR